MPVWPVAGGAQRRRPILDEPADSDEVPARKLAETYRAESLARSRSDGQDHRPREPNDASACLVPAHEVGGSPGIEDTRAARLRSESCFSFARSLFIDFGQA